MFRKMRRFRQQLSEDDCKRVLQTAPRGVLAVLGDEGYPYTVPMNFVYADGCIYYHSAVEGHKLDALRACDKCSFNVLSEPEPSDDGWSYYFNSVTVFGRLSEVEDEAERIEGLRLLGQKYFPTEEMVESDIRKNAARCAVLRLRIEHISGKHVHER